MQTVFSAVLPDVPAAALIWLALLAVAAVAVAGLVVRPDLFRLALAGRFQEAAFPGDPDRAAEQRERSRYVQEVTVAADRAAATAARRRAAWLAVQEEVEAAWEAYQAAEADVRRLAAAAAVPSPRTVRTPAEYADRERYLHRAAEAAHERGDLSAEQLADALAHRDGWDPRRHPVEQELMLYRAVRDNRAKQHFAAAVREQAAWRDAELATAAARSLRDEVFAAPSRKSEPVPSVLPMPDMRRPEPAREATPPARGRAAVAAY
ncbi:hypothetical protein ACFY3U_25425 [Micromonospora sp. NPDC000089]|uniref:hypothetical protein n=1 Tax=unclassified Micromonospora TaxID=2617518 RepID=UPI0036B8E606